MVGIRRRGSGVEIFDPEADGNLASVWVEPSYWHRQLKETV